MSLFDVAVRILIARHFQSVHPDRRGHAALGAHLPSEFQCPLARPTLYLRHHRRST